MTENWLTSTEHETILKFSEATPKVSSICQNLFANFDITHFAYIKFFSDDKFLRLSSDLDWSHEYYDKLFQRKMSFYSNQEAPNQQKSKPFTRCLWSEDTFNEGSSVYHHLKQHNMGNGISLYIRSGDDTETFHFACPVNARHMNNFFINNGEILQEFILFFKLEIEKIESGLSKNALLNIETTPPPQKNDHPHSFTPKRYMFDVEGKKIYLSKRQIQVLYLLSQGKTCGQIGKSLDLQTRTIESYVNGIKQSTGIKSTPHLIDLFSTHNIPTWYRELPPPQL